MRVKPAGWIKACSFSLKQSIIQKQIKNTEQLRYFIILSYTLLLLLINRFHEPVHSQCRSLSILFSNMHLLLRMMDFVVIQSLFSQSLKDI